MNTSLGSYSTGEGDATQNNEVCLFIYLFSTVGVQGKLDDYFKGFYPKRLWKTTQLIALHKKIEQMIS